MIPNSQPSSQPSPALLNDLRSEVSAETAPLLQFILRHAGAITAVVVLLLAAIIGAGIWNWHTESASEDARNELTRIVLTKKGAERTQALAALAKDAPEQSRYAILVEQARSAAEDGDWAQAARAYGEAARLDSEGALGLAALLAQCGALMQTGTAEAASEALAVLQSLGGRVDPSAAPAILRMVAEAALAAGQNDVAATAFGKLAQSGDEEDRPYYAYRAASLGAAPAAADAQTSK